MVFNELVLPSRLLLELLELLFDKFNAVAAAHSVVLGHLQQTVASPSSLYDGDIKLYDMADVWVKIQDVLQVRISQTVMPQFKIAIFDDRGQKIRSYRGSRSICAGTCLYCWVNVCIVIIDC